MPVERNFTGKLESAFEEKETVANLRNISQKSSGKHNWTVFVLVFGFLFSRVLIVEIKGGIFSI